jgi:signal transduction histidine kinase
VLWRDELRVTVEDDGVGVAVEASAVGEGGHGLALHGTLLALVGGTLASEDAPGGGTRVTISLPPRP